MSTVLITGANRGIGLEFCRQLTARGDTVIAACRAPSAALSALPVEVIEGVDVADDAAVASLAETLSGRAIDVLINNAGILVSTGLDALDFDTIRRQFEINSLGPLRVTAALRSNLSAGSKVAIITSRMGSIAENTSGSHYGYRMSKAAVNMAGKCLALDLADDEIAVVLLHPGWVRTDMTANNGLINTDESVAGLLSRIDGLTQAQSGTFWHTNGEALSW
ncbi:MAG: NAD(P)-dependent dehydrogenase (short-subunit alcohol dehydrogenase family) [Myxococcota bacterium]|jgi:NAD(P)-dependent dehydrogenase (short-subunit alcohol dehydrogenase family)